MNFHSPSADVYGLIELYKAKFVIRKLICADEAMRKEHDRILGHIFNFAKAGKAEWEIYKYGRFLVRNIGRFQ